MTRTPNNIQLIIPMSGQGTRYKKEGYTQPKPLIPVNGIPIIERLLMSFPISWETSFILAENHKETELPNFLKSIRPNSKIFYIPIHHKGPTFAVQQVIDQLNANLPAFISYCDYGMNWDPTQFENFVHTSECDACVISYRGFHSHYLSQTTYAYSRIENDRVVELKEKGSFTSNRENEFASSGAYYFKSAKLLKSAIEWQVTNNLEMNGELYTSLTVESLIRMNPDSHVRVFEIPHFFQWGTPEDLKNYEYWENTYSNYNKYNSKNNIKNISQVLMPMAGLGSRFSNLSKTPKPFIKIENKPMFINALNSLPKSSSDIFVTLKTAEPFLQSITEKAKIVYLDQTPPGQALSTKAGLNHLIDKKDVIVSSCDHGIVLDPIKWKEFSMNPKCDAAIFTIKDFPGTLRNPNAFAYVQIDDHYKNETYPIVKSISVKKPISSNPSADPLLVGTFWFKDKSVLSLGIEKLIQCGKTVNGEMYLDSIFELLINSGKVIRTIALDGYINWGDPDSLAEALYWKEVFCGNIRPDLRNRFPGVFE